MTCTLGPVPGRTTGDRYHQTASFRALFPRGSPSKPGRRPASHITATGRTRGLQWVSRRDTYRPTGSLPTGVSGPRRRYPPAHTPGRCTDRLRRHRTRRPPARRWRRGVPRATERGERGAADQGGPGPTTAAGDATAPPPEESSEPHSAGAPCCPRHLSMPSSSRFRARLQRQQRPTAPAAPSDASTSPVGTWVHRPRPVRSRASLPAAPNARTPGT